MLSILNLITESSNHHTPWYGITEKSKVVEKIAFIGIDNNSKKITRPITFIMQKSNGQQFWKRTDRGNEKQIKTLN